MGEAARPPAIREHAELSPSPPIFFSSPRTPDPECAKNGLGLNNLRHTGSASAGYPGQQGPVTAAQSKTKRRAPQGDAELMAEKQVLGFKPAPRLEEVNDEYCEANKGARTSFAIMR